MSFLLNSLGISPSNVLRSLLNANTNPNRVLEVKPAQYSNRNIHCREDGLILYGANQDIYEIVLHRPASETLYQAFSIYRSNNLGEAELRFLQVKDKLPVIIEISKEICNLNGIQKVCDILQEHPTWTITHLAAHFGLLDIIQNPKILSHLNSNDDEGVSPLQVAIKTEYVRVVTAFVQAGASLGHLDNEGNTVYHYAAGTNKEIIQTLTSKDKPTPTLNFRNHTGYTPLHQACLADKPDCVKALLLAGADVNISAGLDQPDSETPPGYVGKLLQDRPIKLHVEDMKYGGTPLHWSLSREVIETLIEMDCDINSVNFDNRTALHIHVSRNRLECVMALLSHEAQVDTADKEGNTPLHLAVIGGHLPLVQALVCFGADLTLINNSGFTPRHLAANQDKILWALHAVGAPRCPESTPGCTRGCIYSNDEYNGTPPPEIAATPHRSRIINMLSVSGMDIAAHKRDGGGKIRGGRVLCLDGGGIRGIILVGILLEIERAIGRPIVHAFDWMAGTSTGGILTLCLASGKTIRECLCLYFRMKDQTFIGSRPYNSGPLESMLKETLGVDTVMADIPKPKLLITGVLADRKPVDLHIFRNYQSPSLILNIEPSGPFEEPPEPERQYLWKAARATGAAPSYFRAYEQFLDGGLVANNPTLDTLTEIHEYNLALQSVGRGSEIEPVSVVVSIGTGIIPLTQLKVFDVFRPESLFDTARLAFGLNSLANLLVDQATAADGRVVDRARAWCSMIGVPYFRFSPQMSEDIAMDEKDDSKLVNLLWETKAYMYSNKHLLQEIASLLNEE